MGAKQQSEHTQETLKQVADELRGLAGEVTALADGLKAIRADSITLKSGQFDLDKGILGIGKFIANAKLAQQEFKLKRGDFRASKKLAGAPPIAPPDAKKTARKIRA